MATAALPSHTLLLAAYPLYKRFGYTAGKIRRLYSLNGVIVMPRKPLITITAFRCDFDGKRRFDTIRYPLGKSIWISTQPIQ